MLTNLPHCLPRTQITYHAPTLHTMLPHCLPCSHIAYHAPTLLTTHQRCLPRTHVAYHAPTLLITLPLCLPCTHIWILRLLWKPKFLHRQPRKYSSYFTGMYIYKSFFNMFRLINVAIIRGSRSVRNMKHFQGKGKAYILEYDISMQWAIVWKIWNVLNSVHFIFFTHDCPLHTNVQVLYFMFYFAVVCTFYLYFGHCYTMCSLTVAGCICRNML